MVSCGETVGDGLASWRHEPGHVSEVARAVRFVERRPMLDPVAERRRHNVGVLGEVIRRGPLWPATLVFENLGQVPVVERHVRLDVGGEQLVDQTAVEVKAGRGDVAVAAGNHRAATRWRTGRRRGRARSSAGHRLPHAPHAHRRHRRCCRRGSPRELCKSGPRCSLHVRGDRPRSGTRTWRTPTRNRPETGERRWKRLHWTPPPRSLHSELSRSS